MKPFICLVITLVACASCVHAEEPRSLFDGCGLMFPNLCEIWRKPSCCSCPNDYCCKPLPTVSCNAKGCVDDYCPKPLPCVSPNAKGCVDDYCRKPFPCFPLKLCEPWYSCGTPQNAVAGQH